MQKKFNISFLIIGIVLVMAIAAMVFFVQRSIKNNADIREERDDEEQEEVVEIKENDENKENLYIQESMIEGITEGKGDVKDYEYDLDLVLDVYEMTMDGVMEFTYYNNSDKNMDELVFYLYANSYEREDYHAIQQEYFYRGYPNGFSPGSIDIHSVDINSGGTYEVTGSQNHLLVVSLDDAVKPDKSTQVKITYTVTIPNSYGRFGYGEQTISAVNCNPIMAVYDEETGYYDYEYNNIGDPFYSEVADYSAKITIDQDYLVAPTGTITNEEVSKGMITYTVDGENRRDFGFVASDDFEVVTQNVNGVQVNSYSFSGDYINKEALQAGVDSIEVFSDVFGQYPYKTFNVVETNFFIGGMEYPGLVLIGDALYTPYNEEIMKMIVAHEAAHQWWYAMVGNDQIAEPWLDEALATFSERVYYEHVYPNNYEDMIYNYVDSYYMNKNQNAIKETTRIDKHTQEYGDEYSLVVYGMGNWMIDDLREMLGEEVFYAALKKYLKDNMFQVATRDDLEQAIEEVWGQDITSWFDENLIVQVGY